MTAAEILIKIKSLFDGRGAKDAVDGINQAGNAAKNAGKGLDEAKGKSAGLGNSFKGAAATAGALNAALANGGPAAQKMGGALNALGGIINGLRGGIAGIATVVIGLAVSAFLKWQKTVEENRRKIEEFRLSQIALKNEMAATKFSEALTEHEKLRAALAAELSAYEKLSAARAAYDAAVKSAKMLEIDALEKEGRLTPEQAARARRGLETQAEAAAADRDLAGKKERAAAAQRDLDAQEAILRDTQKRLADTEAQIIRLGKERESIYGSGAPTRRVPVMGPYGTPTGSYTTVVDKEKQKQRNREIEAQLYGQQEDGGDGLLAQLEPLHKALEAQRKEIEKLKTDLEAARIGVEGAEVSRAAVEQYRPRINAAEDAAADRAAAQANDEAVRERVKTLETLLIGTNENFFRHIEQAYQNLLRDGQANARTLDALIQRTRDLAERNRQTL
jgi:hypothetical protein